MPPHPPANRRKSIDQMNLAELEVFIEDTEAEIRSASCSACRKRHLGPKIKRAEDRMLRLRRANKLARAAEIAAADG